MTKKTFEDIATLVEHAKTLKDVIKEDSPLLLVYQSKVKDPISWDSSALEEKLEVKIPSELRQFWRLTSELRLFVEVNYGQWGVIVYSPEEVINLHQAKRSLYEESFLFGDLVIGDFKGDVQFIVVRCNPEAEDYGSIVVAQPADPRKYWPKVGSSLTEFLSGILDSPYKYYWRF